jgi:hypothetical protein
MAGFRWQLVLSRYYQLDLGHNPRPPTAPSDISLHTLSLELIQQICCSLPPVEEKDWSTDMLHVWVTSSE